MTIFGRRYTKWRRKSKNAWWKRATWWSHINRYAARPISFVWLCRIRHWIEMICSTSSTKSYGLEGICKPRANIFHRNHNWIFVDTFTKIKYSFDARCAFRGMPHKIYVIIKWCHIYSATSGLHLCFLLLKGPPGDFHTTCMAYRGMYNVIPKMKNWPKVKWALRPKYHHTLSCVKIYANMRENHEWKYSLWNSWHLWSYCSSIFK